MNLQVRNRLAAALLAVAAPLLHAAEAFPNRTLTIVVPSPPGMGIDVITRYIAERLSGAVGQQVVVDNKPGAGGVLAAMTALNAKADGYTLVALGTPQSIQVSLPRKTGFDLNKDFAHIAYLGNTPQVLVTSAKGPIKSFSDYLAKAKGEDMNVGAASTLSASHMAMLNWQMQSGLKMNIVPFKGSGDAQIGLAAGDISLMFDSLPAVLPFIKSGKLRALAVGTPERCAGLPDVPTMAELGYPGFNVASWIGYSGNVKMPPEAAKRLADELQKIFADPQTRDRLAELGFYAHPMTPEQYTNYVKQEVAKWTQLIRTSNIKID